MSFRSIDIVLFVALVATLLLTWVGDRDYAQPNVEFIPDMAHSVAYDPYAPNPNSRDGKTLQRPPAGTIAQGLAPLGYEATPEDALRAGREMESPVALDDPDVLHRGAKVYASFCQQCHGPTGLGNGAVAKRGFPPPPSLLLENALQMRDGQMFHVLTYGQGNMPPHASQLSRADRWHAIAHIRALQDRTPATPAESQSPSPEILRHEPSSR